MQVDVTVYQNIDWLLSFEAKRALIKFHGMTNEDSRFWVHPLSDEFDISMALVALGLLTFREHQDVIGTFWFTQLGYGYTLGIVQKTTPASA